MMFALLAAASLVAEAEQVLASQTPNPSAVQFSDVREGDGVVCGRINRPNRAGGYDGFRPFAYYSRDRWMWGTSDGVVVENGVLVDVGYLMATERNLDELNTALADGAAQLRGCSGPSPEQLNSN
jgi:hypothetical protein